MAYSVFPKQKQFNPWGFFRVLSILVLELAIIHFARHTFGFECHIDQFALCEVARSVLVATYGLSAVVLLLAMLRADAFRDLIVDADVRVVPVSVNVLGLSALLATLPFLRSDGFAAAPWLISIIWLTGGTALVAGAVLMCAPLARWGTFLRRVGWTAPLVCIAGALAPFAATAVRPLWKDDLLSEYTFYIVEWMLKVFGAPVETTPATKVIGAGDFFVNIAPACSGIEGLVLTTTFATIYLVLFRRDLRFPHSLLILPVALIASWLLNSVRIAVLVQIGISGYPELAIGGFHSHAGWMMFTVLSLAIVLAAQSIPFFHKTKEGEQQVASAEVPPFFQDPIVAQILPFAVFMVSALFASTFSQNPALVYPLRAVAMGAVLAIFWPYLRDLRWRLDPLAVLIGILIASYWIGFAPSADAEPPFAALGTVGAAVWLVFRCIGTSVFVPIIEELFFRQYLIDRIAPHGATLMRSVIAVLVTSALFAVLHDRWIEAGIAGIAFALLMLRSRNITDAIVAHAVANALIAGWALVFGNWAMI